MTATIDRPADAPSRLDVARDLITNPDATLNDVAEYLRQAGAASINELSNGDETDAISLRTARALGVAQAMCGIAADVIGRFDADTRSAPSAALAELMSEVLQPCEAFGCDQLVAPWGPNTCGDECATRVRREAGETS